MTSLTHSLRPSFCGSGNVLNSVRSYGPSGHEYVEILVRHPIEFERRGVSGTTGAGALHVARRQVVRDGPSSQRRNRAPCRSGTFLGGAADHGGQRLDLPVHSLGEARDPHRVVGCRDAAPRLEKVPRLRGRAAYADQAPACGAGARHLGGVVGVVRPGAKDRRGPVADRRQQPGRRERLSGAGRGGGLAKPFVRRRPVGHHAEHGRVGRAAGQLGGRRTPARRSLPQPAALRRPHRSQACSPP